MRSSIFSYLPWNIKTLVVRLTEKVLDGKAWVYGTTRSNKGHSTWRRTGSQPLEKGAVSILEARCYNGPLWMERIVQMISTIHDATTVNTNLGIQKSCAVVQYNKFTKDIDGADQYLSFYSLWRKTVKWPNVPAKLCTLQGIFVHKPLNTNKKWSTRTSCTVWQGTRYQKSSIQPSPVLMNFNGQKSNQHQAGLSRTPQKDWPEISASTNWKKLLMVGKARRSILHDSVKCMLHIRREVKQATFVNSALFHLTNGLVLTNTSQLGTTKTLYMQLLQYWVQEYHLYSQTVWI